MQAVLLGGLIGKSEAVGAANPYGCNGEQHKPGCPRIFEEEERTEKAPTKKSPKVEKPRNEFREKAAAAKKTGLTAPGFPDKIGVHPRFKKEVCCRDRIRESQSALRRVGIEDKDEQTRIHYEIAAMFENLIQSANPPTEEEAKKNKKKRQKAWHYRIPRAVSGATRPVVADFTVLQMKGRKEPELYSYFLRTGKAPSQENSPK